MNVLEEVVMNLNLPRVVLALNQNECSWNVENYNVRGVLETPIFEIRRTQWQLKLEPQHSPDYTLPPLQFSVHPGNSISFIVKSWNKERTNARFELEIVDPRSDHSFGVFSANIGYDFRYEQHVVSKKVALERMPYLRRHFVVRFYLDNVAQVD